MRGVTRRRTASVPRGAVLAALAALVASVSLASCASLGDDRFLLRKLDAEAKADALTRAGIEQYTVRLVQRGEYEAVKDVRAYFDAALRYDPSSTQAKQYLDLVDTYFATRLKESLGEADRLSAKKTRTRDEDWQVVAAVQKAVRLDGQNEHARQLERETAVLRDTLVKEGLAQESATTAKIGGQTTDDVRDGLWIDAYLAAGKVLTIDARNETALTEWARTRRGIEEAFDRRLAAVRGLLDQSRFTASKAEVAEMSELNRRSGGVGDASVQTAAYELNYRWARWLYTQKDYASAEVKAKAALAARRTSDATALAKRIADARAQTEPGASFETAVQDIDRLIGDGELAAAESRLEALQRSTTDTAKLAALDARGERIRSFLPDLYTKGLAAYRDERFADAIEVLETVTSIDMDYEQAADYLEKARSKQHLIEQY